MKIRIALTVDVDPQKWADSNGRIVDDQGKFTIADVREDLRSYVLTCVQGAALLDETDADVSLAS